MKSLSLIVPIFNESATIPKLVNQLLELGINELHEVIFVDDGSSDNSKFLLESLLVSTKLPYRILSKKNGGKSSAIKLGSEILTSSHVLIVDADLELKIEDIPKLWTVVLNNESDFVFGARVFTAQGSFSWRYTKANKFLSNLFGLLFDVLVTDIMCGYKLVPVSFLAKLDFKLQGFAIELEIPLEMMRQEVSIYEVPVQYWARRRADGKKIRKRDGLKIILLMLQGRVGIFLRKKH
jgi:glycosyltransferase involved in cell wall biosynthesis